MKQTLFFLDQETKHYSNFLRRLISSGNHFLLSFHVNPDQDSIGSNMALALLLESLGKQVTVIWGPSGKKSEFDYLSEYQLKKNIGKTKTFDAMICETSIADLLSKVDTLVILDSANIDRIGLTQDDISKHSSLSIFTIDHHAGNDMEYISENQKFIQVKASSTCEILAKMFYVYNPGLLNIGITEMLKIGIYSDTNGFKNSVNVETLSIFTELFRISPSMKLIDHMNRSATLLDRGIGKQVFEQVTLYKYKGVTHGICILDLDLIQEVRFEFYDEINVNLKELSEHPSTHVALELLERYKDIDVLWVSFEQPDTDPIYFRTSIRSNGKNVDGVAKKMAEYLGGSGHLNAAGTKIIANTKQEVFSKIVEAIKTL